MSSGTLLFYGPGMHPVHLNNGLENLSLDELKIRRKGDRVHSKLES